MRTFQEIIILSEHVNDPAIPNTEMVTYYKEIRNVYKVEDMKKLSEIKAGDIFIFEPGKKPRYICSASVQYSTLDSTEGLIFHAIQKNKKSVKCRIHYGRIEYTFKFDGVYNNYEPATDYTVQLVTPEPHKNTYL